MLPLLVLACLALVAYYIHRRWLLRRENRTSSLSVLIFFLQVRAGHTRAFMHTHALART